MKYVKQFLIILIMAVLGGILNWLIPLPIPATVWGMLLMFIALMCGVVKLDQVEDTADFFMGIMPMLFVPLAVGLMDTWQILADYAMPIIIIVVASFFICYAVTGKTADIIISRSSRADASGKEEHHE
ncbi:MAG: CidA/LrgA family protein [Firmicutes bacterium]|nr:CidA/LrgA family protein [Bacillota bacterium]